ncbi:unnamed protein product [Cochlearia groenlandica]
MIDEDFRRRDRCIKEIPVYSLVPSRAKEISYQIWGFEIEIKARLVKGSAYSIVEIHRAKAIFQIWTIDGGFLRELGFLWKQHLLRITSIDSPVKICRIFLWKVKFIQGN